MITKKQYQDALKIVKEYRDQLAAELAEADKVLNPNQTKLITEYPMSARLRNAIIFGVKGASEMTLQEFVDTITRERFVRLRNLGEKSIVEFEQLLKENGSKLRG